MKPLFQSPDLQADFERDGFVKIALLSAEDVSQLMTDYSRVSAEHESVGMPYITTSHTNNRELILKVDKYLQDVMVPAISRHMKNHEVLFGNFLLKMPGDNSETAPHQDITFVDENEFASANVWVALQDTDETNGGMYFLPESHRFIFTIRPTHTYPWAYEKVVDEIKKKSVSFSAKAGDAFIFHHGVIHGSFANLSSVPRLACVMAVHHADAQLVHYYLPEGKGNVLHKYKMDKEAYLSFQKKMPPSKGVFDKEVDYDFHQVNKAELHLFLKRGKPRKSMFDKLFKIFG